MIDAASRAEPRRVLPPSPTCLAHSKGRHAMFRAATPERLSALSDGVFAVLITVLVLDLTPPELPSFTALMSLSPTW